MTEPDNRVPTRRGLVQPVRVDPTGRAGPTRGQAAGPGWRRTSRGLYVPTTTDANVVEQRILEAASVLPSAGGLTGWAALRWCGAHWFDGMSPDGRRRLDVDLATCPQDIRNQPGHRVWQERLTPAELVEVDGVQVTTAVR